MRNGLFFVDFKVKNRLICSTQVSRFLLNMAQRRMFSPDIVSSEEFLDMPVSSRELYFQLGMNADDDGFIQPKIIMRIIRATDDDLKVLLSKRFLLRFQSGVVVIKHWLIHNMIRQDRYKPTRFQDEKKTLQIKENKAYTDKKSLLATNGLQNGNQMAPQVRLGKVRLVNIDIGAKAPIHLFLEVFNKFFNTKFRDTDKRITLLNKRLKTYSLEEILLAVKKISADKFYQGNNDRGWRADPDYILRSDEQIDKFLNKKEPDKYEVGI